MDILPLAIGSIALLWVLLRLETRISGIPAKESGKCLLDIYLSVGQSETINLFEKRESLLIFCRRGDEILARRIIKELFVRQHLVPNETATAECLGNLLFLSFRWVNANLDSPLLKLHVILFWPSFFLE